MGAQASKQVARKFPQQANPETLSQVPKTSPSSTYHPQSIGSAKDTPYIADGRSNRPSFGHDISQWA
jgi:hypothetical protein